MAGASAISTPIALAIAVSTANRTLLEALTNAASGAGSGGLSGAAVILLTLIPPGGSKPIKLAALSGQTRQGTGQILNDLEARGFVSSGPDPEDERAKRVTLTAQGAHLRDRLLAAGALVDADAVAALLRALDQAAGDCIAALKAA
jgi:DNA-binding MarR family transcriptional regulator